MNSRVEKAVDSQAIMQSSIQHQSSHSHTTQWEYLSAKDLDQTVPGCIDSIGLLSGIANTIMQLTYPGVGHGVMESPVQSGSVIHHPFKRARTTLTYLSVAMHGTTEEKLAYRRAINKVHAQVVSTEKSPMKYRALDPDLQLWVAACLFWGYFDVYEKFRGPMSPEDQETFYQLAKPLGTTLQVKEDMWPDTIEDFWCYWNSNLEKLELPDDVRIWLGQLVNVSFLGSTLNALLGNFATLMTTGFLHPHVREQMRLPWGDKEKKSFNRHIKIIGALNNNLPRVIRQLPGNLFLWDFRRRLKKGMPLN